jgi:hypothetical protein
MAEPGGTTRPIGRADKLPVPKAGAHIFIYPATLHKPSGLIFYYIMLKENISDS